MGAMGGGRIVRLSCVLNQPGAQVSHEIATESRAPNHRLRRFALAHEIEPFRQTHARRRGTGRTVYECYVGEGMGDGRKISLCGHKRLQLEGYGRSSSNPCSRSPSLN